MSNDRNESITRVLGNINQALSQIDVRLREVEHRLGQIRNSDQNIILEERRVIEGPGQLGGRRLGTSTSGAMQREVRVPFCDTCGTRIEEDFVVCHKCKGKLCKSCAVLYGNTNLCLTCLRNILPLTKQAYKVLVAIANQIDKVKEISRLTKIARDDVKICRYYLLGLGLAEKRGIIFYSETCITDAGLEAISAYRQVYGKDDDIALLDVELKRHLAEKSLGK